MVLWVLAILMVIALSFSVITRTETHSALSFKEGMERKFLAEAGIERAIAEIYYTKMNRNVEGNDAWKADGTSHSDSLGDGEYTVSTTDESGKININALTDSSGIILKNLLMNSGVEEETANTIVDSVLDWKESSSTGAHRLSGAGDDYYMSLPTPYKAKHANFDTLEELLLVKGVTPQILYGDGEKKGIIDFITIYSTTPTISVNAAPEEVLTAVPGITPEIADAIIGYRENEKINNMQEVGIPQQSIPFINFAESSVFSIESIGEKGEGKSGYPIRATVRLDGNNKYTFLYYKSPVTVNK